MKRHGHPASYRGASLPRAPCSQEQGTVSNLGSPEKRRTRGTLSGWTEAPA
jgi:hypothetical protein